MEERIQPFQVVYGSDSFRAVFPASFDRHLSVPPERLTSAEHASRFLRTQAACADTRRQTRLKKKERKSHFHLCVYREDENSEEKIRYVRFRSSSAGKNGN